MKRYIVYSAVIAFLVIGCSDSGTNKVSHESTSKEVKDVATKVVEQVTDKVSKTTKDVVSDVVENTKETTSKAVEATKEVATNVTESAEKAVEATKEVAANAAESAEKAVEATKEVATNVAESAKETVSKAVEETKEAVTSSVNAKEVFKKCSGCHGTRAEKKALGKSKVIAGWEKEKLITVMKGYKDGSYGGAMKGLMQGQVKNLSDEEVEALAGLISEFY